MRGLLFSQMDPPEQLEAEFHEWYDDQHIPNRLRLPGFGSAVRYEAVDDATRFLVCYFIDDLGVLDTDEYARLKREPDHRTERMLAAVSNFTRYTCRLVSDTGSPPDGTLAIVHALRVSGDIDELESTYSSWVLDADAGRRRTRLYRPFGPSVGEPWTHIAIHDVHAGASAGSVTSQLQERVRHDLIDADAWWAYRQFRRFGDDGA